MAKLSPETKTILNALMENLVEVIDEAKRAEFLIQEEFGETAQTMSVLDELAEIAQQAQGLYSQISTLRLRVAEAQPILLPDMLNLLEQRIILLQNRVPALEQSLKEIKLDWRQS
jgi:Rad3-related DNA helicase